MRFSEAIQEPTHGQTAPPRYLGSRQHGGGAPNLALFALLGRRARHARNIKQKQGD
jgi:hypothetical protein